MWRKSTYVEKNDKYEVWFPISDLDFSCRWGGSPEVAQEVLKNTFGWLWLYLSHILGPSGITFWEGFQFLVCIIPKKFFKPPKTCQLILKGQSCVVFMSNLQKRGLVTNFWGLKTPRRWFLPKPLCSSLGEVGWPGATIDPVCLKCIFWYHFKPAFGPQTITRWNFILLGCLIKWGPNGKRWYFN